MAPKVEKPEPSPELLAKLKDMTPAQLIERALTLKNWLEAEADRFKQHLAPVNLEQDTIKNVLLERLNEQGVNSFPTDNGVAYKSTLLNIKITDRDAFLKCVLENWQDFGGAMLMAGAQMDAVKEFLEKHNEPPPGIEISWYSRLNIKKG